MRNQSRCGNVGKEYLEKRFRGGWNIFEGNEQPPVAACWSTTVFFSSPRNAPSLIEYKESVPCSYSVATGSDESSSLHRTLCLKVRFVIASFIA